MTFFLVKSTLFILFLDAPDWPPVSLMQAARSLYSALTCLFLSHIFLVRRSIILSVSKIWLDCSRIGGRRATYKLANTAGLSAWRSSFLITLASSARVWTWFYGRISFFSSSDASWPLTTAIYSRGSFSCKRWTPLSPFLTATLSTSLVFKSTSFIFLILAEANLT